MQTASGFGNLKCLKLLPVKAILQNTKTKKKKKKKKNQKQKRERERRQKQQQILFLSDIIRHNVLE